MSRQRYHPTDFGPLQWRRLLDFALKRADALELAVPYRVVSVDFPRSPLWPPPLETLRHDIIDRHVSVIRWSRLQEEPTQFVRLHLTPALASYARTLGELTRWRWARGAPEDPRFLVGGQPLLEAESHSGRITVYATPDELRALEASGLRLLEPLGVEAEPWPTP